MKLCWVEKLVLTAFLCVAAFLLFLGQTGTTPPAYQNVTAAQHWDAFFSILWTVGLNVFLPLWIVLRAVDFLFGGPARRRGAVTVRRIY